MPSDTPHTDVSDPPFALDDLERDALDVIVVGGGVAGAYAAWRLQTGEVDPLRSKLPAAPQDRAIALLEASGRIGGRLESLSPPGAPELVAEFGGMGFTAKNTILTALVDDVFDIAAEPFPRGGEHNLFYLRGVRLTKAEVVDPTKVPYNLTAEERENIASGPMGLIVWAIEKVLPGATSFDAAKWKEVQEDFLYRGRHLRDIGFWNLLQMNMSNEAFSYAHDAIGHYFEVSNWNCAEALPWFLGDGDAAYRTLTNGYDQLPITCATAFTKEGGGLFPNTVVTGIVDNGDGTLGVQTNRYGAPIPAKRVVLALPQRALQILAPACEPLRSGNVPVLLDTVTGRKVMKIFLAYDEPWWEQLGITEGSSSTDLPLGQAWYFSAPGGAASTKSLLMASYNDTLATTYWEGLEGGETFENPVGSEDTLWTRQAPSALMVEEVQRQLALLHGIDPPAPYAASYRDWSLDPYGGAFYTWNVGVNGDETRAAVLEPVEGVPLNICGSAYSVDQGWAEGALATAEQVVTDKIGLLSPPWLE